MHLRKYTAFLGVVFLFFQGFPLSLSQVHAEAAKPSDVKMIEDFHAQQLEYMPLNQPTIPFEKEQVMLQEFSFVDKTFRTLVGQTVILRFTSTLPADEVLVRIPTNGKIMETAFSNGESIHHSHGEYWLLKTSIQQTDFVLPVVFETAGQYFLTIDHDADHFYLEVVEGHADISSAEPEAQENTNLSEKEETHSKDQQQETQDAETMNGIPGVIQPVAVSEKNLSISEELIAVEDARILEEITEPQNRNTSTVTNWSQFRSAWNSSRTSIITLNGHVSFSSSILGDSLSARSNSVAVRGTTDSLLNFRGSNNSLSMSGGDLMIQIWIQTDSSSSSNISTAPLVNHSGVGTITLTGGSLLSYRVAPVVYLSGQSVFRMEGNWVVNANERFDIGPTPISLADHASFIMTGGRIGSTRGQGISRPIESSANTNIYIRGDNIMMAGNLNIIGVLLGTAFRIPWHSADVHLTGINGSIVVSSTSNPNDFEERYLLNHGNLSYRSLIVGATDTSWVDPPMPSYNLILQASPSEGGSPTSELKTIEQNKKTSIHANPNEGYRFVKWEIVSGTNAKIANETAENTTFTMGNSAASVRAIYEKELTNVNPLDPLDPDKEIDPENPPVLPEDQGLFSIDFVSQFDFGSQVISAQDKTYYAKPQRLVSEDGSVIEGEERPNYVQISDRRSGPERDGWELAVQQNEQFHTKTGKELVGARLVLQNQQVVTAKGGIEPGLQFTNPMALIPGGTKRTLLKAQGPEGVGTWIYRFGNADSAAQSVALEVPKGAIPSAESYTTTLTWELSSVPNN